MNDAQKINHIEQQMEELSKNLDNFQDQVMKRFNHIDGKIDTLTENQVSAKKERDTLKKDSDNIYEGNKRYNILSVPDQISILDKKAENGIDIAKEAHDRIDKIKYTTIAWAAGVGLGAGVGGTKLLGLLF